MKDQNPELFEYYNIKEIKKYYLDKKNSKKLKDLSNLNKTNKDTYKDNKKSYSYSHSYFILMKEK
jgi:hypothetical protein